MNLTGPTSAPHPRPSPASPAAVAAAAAQRAFGDDLTNLGARDVAVDGDALVARFDSAEAASLANAVVRDDVLVPPALGGGVARIRFDPAADGSGGSSVAASDAARAIGKLAGVREAQAFDAVKMLTVLTEDDKSAARLSRLLEPTVDGFSVVVAKEIDDHNAGGWGSGIGQ